MANTALSNIATQFAPALPTDRLYVVRGGQSGWISQANLRASVGLPAGTVANTVRLASGADSGDLQTAIDDAPTDGTLHRIVVPNEAALVQDTTVIVTGGRNIELFCEGPTGEFLHTARLDNNPIGTSVAFFIGRLAGDTTSISSLHCHNLKLSCDTTVNPTTIRTNVFEFGSGSQRCALHDLTFYHISATICIIRGSDIDDIQVYHTNATEWWEQYIEIWNGVNLAFWKNVGTTSTANPNLSSTKPFGIYFDNEGSNNSPVMNAWVAKNNFDFTGVPGAVNTGGIAFGAGTYFEGMAYKNVSVVENTLTKCGFGVRIQALIRNRDTHELNTNLYASLNLSEGVAGTLADASGNGHSLTASNTTQETGPHGNTVTRFQSANSSYAVAANDTHFGAGSGSWTGAIQVYFDARNTTAGIVGKWTEAGNQRSWRLIFTGNGTDTLYARFEISSDGTEAGIVAVDSGGYNFSLARWTTVLFGYDTANDYIFYHLQDGTDTNHYTTIATKAFTGTIFSSTAIFEMGRINGANYADVRLARLHRWERILTDAEKLIVLNDSNGQSYNGIRNGGVHTTLTIANNTINEPIFRPISDETNEDSYDTSIIIQDNTINDIAHAHYTGVNLERRLIYVGNT